MLTGHYILYISQVKDGTAYDGERRNRRREESPHHMTMFSDAGNVPIHP